MGPGRGWKFVGRWPCYLEMNWIPCCKNPWTLEEFVLRIERLQFTIHACDLWLRLEVALAVERSWVLF
jgi:pyrroloquinoline quinone (PQQ) biosynthesis protein C